MVSNRFTGRTCVLCPSPSTRRGEHVWPLWLIGDFDGEGPFHTEKSGEPYLKRDGVTVAEFSAVQGVHVPMCDRCNGILNQFIEDPAKPVIRSAMPMTATHSWPTLSPSETGSLARWFLKVALLLSHPEAESDNPHATKDAAATRLSEFRNEWVSWMVAEVDPPEGFSVYLARRSAEEEPTFAGEREHLLLPGRVVIDGDDQVFMTRSVGVRGLQATIVWHPGWPIQHPLVESGRAALLWPDPVAIDLVDLPEIHALEFTFAMDPSPVLVTAAQHERITQVPLQVGLLPQMAIFNDIVRRGHTGPESPSGT